MIEGLDALKSLLNRLHSELPNQIIPSALNVGTETLGRSVEQECPVQTGALREATKVLKAKVSKNYVSAQVVNTSPHAAAVEYGTSDTPADPFMRRAADADGQRVLDQVTRDIAQAIESFR